MSKRIRSTSKQPKRIRVTSKAPNQVSSDNVAEALGANAEHSVRVGTKGSPISFLSLRQSLLQGLVSSGGRPGRKGVLSRKKIPITEEEWDDLKLIAEAMKKLGLPASPGQVAGAMIQRSLANIHEQVQAVEDSGEEFLAAAASSGELLGEDMRVAANELLRKMSSGGGLESYIDVE